MKTSEAFQICTQCVENKWEGNRVPLVKENLIVPNKRVTELYFILCDMRLPCSKLNNSNLIKERNIIFAVSILKYKMN